MHICLFIYFFHQISCKINASFANDHKSYARQATEEYLYFHDLIFDAYNGVLLLQQRFLRTFNAVCIFVLEVGKIKCICKRTGIVP